VSPLFELGANRTSSVSDGAVSAAARLVEAPPAIAQHAPKIAIFFIPRSPSKKPSVGV
jgi:hypothetical protein